MKHFLFRLTDPMTIEECEKILKKKRIQGIYVLEDDATGEQFIGGYGTKIPEIKGAFLVEENTGVDWEQQWSFFAQDFHEGKAHIDLNPFGCDRTLLLLPGPGFGDLSHPTTYLMIEMMQHEVTNETVIDIGTGSGILSLAALHMGAIHAYGIDIDPEAIEHAKKNAAINSLEASSTFGLHLPKLALKSVALMNMILPEQQIVNPSQWNQFAKKWITSGILEEQKQEYLRLAKKWGWNIVSEHRRGDWMGWVFATA